MATVDTEIREWRQFIGGGWIGAEGGETFDDVDPFTGEAVARIPAGGREDARRAVEAAAETFGPVAAIEVVDDADEAVARANATSYGLASGVITNDVDKGLELAQRIEAGIVHINDQPVADEPQMPFGGVKDSGWGRFGGTAVIDEFTEVHWITVGKPHPFPF
jgi:acyl-CoA reductase-like NAD-dependent aldehyde dehydrogenase